MEMTMIKLEIPSSDEIAMFHMGEALRNMAVDYGYVVPSKCNITHTETVGDVSHSVKVESYVPVNSNVTLSTADGNFILSSSDESELSESIDNMTNAIAAEHEIPVNRLLGASDTIDADGLPWDQRIHSRGKTRLADNTWRMARKPSDKSDEEWAEYVEGVKTELKALMDIPVAVTYYPNEADPFAIEPPVSEVVENTNLADAFDNFLDGTPPVDAAVIAPTPPIDFGGLMRFITANKAKLPSPVINEVLADQGIPSLTLLAVRPDLFPQIHAALVKLL